MTAAQKKAFSARMAQARAAKKGNQNNPQMAAARQSALREMASSYK